MRAPRPLPSKRAARRGSVSFEALLVLPLLLMVVCGGVGLADLLVSEQMIDEASAKAARTAALGGSAERVRQTARAALGPKRAEHAEITVRVIRAEKADERRDDPEQDRGGDDYHPAPGDLLEVRVTIPARHATATALAPIKGGKELVGRSVIQHE